MLICFVYVLRYRQTISVLIHISFIIFDFNANFFFFFSDWNGFRIRSLLPMERKRRDCEQQCGYKVCPFSFSLKTFNKLLLFLVHFFEENKCVHYYKFMTVSVFNLNLSV
jgi:hypothetical protein